MKNTLICVSFVPNPTYNKVTVTVYTDVQKMLLLLLIYGVKRNFHLLNKGPFHYARLDPFGDHGQSFGPIFTKLGTEGAFMGLLMM